MNLETVHHETAGGVVFNSAGQLLVLVRDIEREGAMRHEVRLPKGHVDPGETHEEAALREVCEESGYCSLEVLADLGTMESAFDFNGRHHVRTEHYFLMRLTDEKCTGAKPMGAEEALFSAVWLERQTAPMSITYASEQAFAQRGIEAWEKAEA